MPLGGAYDLSRRLVLGLRICIFGVAFLFSLLEWLGQQKHSFVYHQNGRPKPGGLLIDPLVVKDSFVRPPWSQNTGP